MSISTYIHFRNANDPAFLAAKNGTPKELEEWEDENGSIEDRPGAEIDFNSDAILLETEDEYGGRVIPIADIPKEATHIVIYRG